MIVIDPVSIVPGTSTRASSASYWGKVGDAVRLLIAGNNEFRMSLDPANPDEPPLPLIEGAATDVILYPSRFENPAWVEASTPVGMLPKSVQGPDGLLSATRLYDIDNAARSGKNQAAPCPNDALPRIVFAVVKKTTGAASFPGLQIQYFGGTTITAAITINTDSGAVADRAGFTPTSKGCEDFGDYWLAWVGLPNNASGTTLCVAYLYPAVNADGTGNWTNSATGYVDVWRIGITEGTEPSSVIPDNTAFISRAGAKWEFNNLLQLTQYAADISVTAYDPVTGLSRGLSLEPAVLNAIRNSTMVGGSAITNTLPTNWGAFAPAGISREIVKFGLQDGIDYIDIRFSGTPASSGNIGVVFEPNDVVLAANSQTWTASIYRGLAGGSYLGLSGETIRIDEYTSAGGFVAGGLQAISTPGNDQTITKQRISYTRTLSGGGTVQRVNGYWTVSAQIGAIVDITIRIGLPQLEQNPWASSPIKTSGSSVIRAADISASTPTTRAADVLPTTPGLLYSNVPIPEPAYSNASTYALGVKVVDSATMTVYESLAAGNTGNPLSDATKWAPRGATNRWAMLDEYGSTRTEQAEEIVVVLDAKQISQGLYLGNVDANEVSLVVQDLVEGVVYRESHSLVLSTSKSSFFRWFFGRIRRKNYFVTVRIPVYVNAIATLRIKRPGATAKCGVCAIGALADVGLAEYGLSTEIKDYSSTTFNFDGTSNTVVRGYSKRMSVDVRIRNEEIDAVQEMLARYRQKNLVWVGAVMYGSAILFGKYSSFKNVIDTFQMSKMSLQIEGTVQ